MSMILCEGCKALIDSDDDPFCFVEIGNMRRMHKEIVLCEPCREKLWEKLEHEESIASAALNDALNHLERNGDKS